jgi:O-antigen/teichoic acid export membrane protein
VQNVYAAKHLGPEGFGVYAIVTILSMMAAVGNFGYLGAAARELPHYRSLDDDAAAAAVLNHTAIGELVIALIWTTVILCIALLQRDPETSLLLLLVAASVVPNKLAALYQVIAYAEKEFGVQSTIELGRTFLATILVLLLIPPIGIAAVLGAPVVSSLLAVWLYRRHFRLDLNLRGTNRSEFIRLAKIGLPVTGLNIVSGSAGVQRWAERSLIQLHLGTASLGMYAFSAWVVTQLLAIMGVVMQAVQPHVYELLSRDLDTEEVKRYLLRPMRTIALCAALVVGLLVAMLPDIISAVLPEYAPGIPVLHVLLVATFCSAVSWLPSVVLYAARFNGQLYYLGAWTIAVAVSVVLAFVLLAMDGGLIGVAVGYLVSQVIVMVMVYRRLGSFLFPAGGDLSDFIRGLALPVANVAAAIAAVHIVDRIAGWPPVGTAGLLLAGAKGLGFTIFCTPTLLAMERRYGILAALRASRTSR